MPAKEKARLEWTHKDLASRIRYALYGPGYSSAEGYWASAVKLTTDWQQPQSPLLPLPAEIRFQIYEYVAELDINTPGDPLSSPHSIQPRYLLGVCSQLFLETEGMPLSIDLAEHFWEGCFEHYRFRGLEHVRLTINCVSVFYISDLKKLKVKVPWWPRELLCKKNFPDLQRVCFKLRLEHGAIKGMTDRGALPSTEPTGVAVVKAVWEEEMRMRMKGVRKFVEVKFEYEEVDGRGRFDVELEAV